MKLKCLLLCQLFSICLFSQNIIFVNQNVQGGALNGSSWQNSFQDLQVALQIAVEGDEIWVAKGDYLPTTDTDRNKSFILKQGVRLYGGFSGTESSLGQRDFILNESVLSGNIGDPNGSDNVYHVIRCEGVDSTCILDGFTITKGNANGSGENSNGGGMLIIPSDAFLLTSPIIQNCTFIFNFGFTGGAISAERSSTQNYLNPIIRNCQFISNRSKIYGGALAKVGPAHPEIPFVLEHCIFSQNACISGEGGGIFISKSEHRTIIRNCLFEKDSAKISLGGGIYFASGYEEFIGSTLSLNSCVFRENIASEGGGLFSTVFGVPNFSTPPYVADITNCVFEKNRSTNGIGAAYGIIGFNKCNIFVTVENCRIIENKSNTYSITYVEGMTESNIVMHVKGCTYYANRRSGNPSDGTFPIIYGLGGHQGKFDAVIENCLFFENGGGISSVCSDLGGKVNTKVANCTFYNNDGFILNKSYYPEFNGIDDYVKMYVDNCIIWEQGTSLWDMFADNNLTIQNVDGYEVDHCLLSLDSVTVSLQSIFGDNILTNNNPQFVDISNNDFHLTPCSPAVNVGNNAIVDSLELATDLDGNPRKTFNIVDLGAFESFVTCQSSTNDLTNQSNPIISPNPVDKNQTITVNTSMLNLQDVNWKMWNVCGQPVSSGNMYSSNGILQIESPDLPGMYILELSENLSRFWIKLIVPQ